MTGIYYGFWEYWELYHKVTFDGVNKLILINDGVTYLDVQTDIYSAWKEWVSLEENIKYLPPLLTVGGEPTISGQRLDVTYFLINGWKLKPYSGSYDLNIVGNLYEVNGGSIKVPADVIGGYPNNISISLNTSVIVRQVDTGAVGGLTPEEHDTLYNIEGKVIQILNMFNQPIVATLETTQAIQLSNIEDKLREIWELHGLDMTKPLTVTKTTRVFGDVDQTIETTGTGELQETTITRI